jgi:hypothetical protein
MNTYCAQVLISPLGSLARRWNSSSQFWKRISTGQTFQKFFIREWLCRLLVDC